MFLSGDDLFIKDVHYTAYEEARWGVDKKFCEKNGYDIFFDPKFDWNFFFHFSVFFSLKFEGLSHSNPEN